MLNTIEYAVTSLVCLITAVVIQRIYFKEKRRGASAQAIAGIKWFGLAILIWGIGGLVNLICVSGLHMAPTNKGLIYLGVTVSLVNSLFILLSLPSIEHQSSRSVVVRMVERFSVREFFMVFGGILLMIAFVFVAASYNNASISNNFIWLIDIPISIVVAFSLLNELNKAFINRAMRFMLLPSFALFVLIVIAVTHRIIPQDRAIAVVDQQFWGLLGIITAISFKFLFILLFSILLYSWKFLSEKEEQESQMASLQAKLTSYRKEKQRLTLSIESHLDTIESLKKEVKELRVSAQVVLSERQKEVLGNLGLYGGQKSYTEIAEAMNISVDGFQAHIHQIKKLLNISGTGGKEQLISFAKEQDLLRFATIKSDA
ncbi:hypothetical protein ACFQ1M_04520 [Sungkyunkwania multivorans]|uniref:HTH luxR-type domain-containing protein n=1 Tax=Sungkyunkwania multivorans TaxID=1173618 RepID=A0ABW3CVX9_9FLAO